MKILGLHIYAYGKLENVVIEDLNHIQVFYGKNEAGKSTIMSFIHSVLFGFPTRQQHSELRYEPKKGTNYGGQLIVEFEGRGQAVIERVKGKSTGDVNVRLEDGTHGGENLLRELLSFIDKSLFQSIYSFNLHGLQNVHQIKGEDLGRFLFSTGSVGSDRLLMVETKLQKELDARFKPGGKNPDINVKLKELREVHNDLKKAELHNDQYWKLLNEKELLQQDINNLQKEMVLLQSNVHRLEEWKKIQPLVHGVKILKAECERYSISNFPMDGITRLNQLEQMIQPIVVRINSLKERINVIEKEIEANKPNTAIVEKESQITSAIENIPLYESLKEEEAKLYFNKNKLRDDLLEIKDKLNLYINDEQILNSNTSIFIKEKTAEAQRKQILLKEKKQHLDDSFNEEKRALEVLEEEMTRLKSELLPYTEREQLEKKVINANSKNELEKELANTLEKLQFFRKSEQRIKQQMNQSKKQVLFFGIVLVILATWGVWSSQWVMTAIGAIGCLYLLYILKNTARQAEAKEIGAEIKAILKQEETLTSQLHSSSLNTDFIEKQLEKDTLMKSRFHLLEAKWEQQNEQYEKVIRAFEKWEKEAIEHEKVLIDLGNELLIPKSIAVHFVHDAFLLIEKLKDIVREKSYIEEQLTNKQASIQKIKNTLKSLMDQFLADKSESIIDGSLLLRKQLKTELEKQVKVKEKSEKLVELQDELQKLESEHKHFEIEKRKLLQLANVETEDQFRITGEVFYKRKELEEKIENLQRQIKLSSLTDKEVEKFITMDVEEEYFKCTTHLEETKDKLPKSLEQLADLKYEISVLEEGGRYADLLHRFKRLQSELELEAKEWAKYAVAKEMLNLTVQRFKDERLPTMLAKAEEYLSFLTDGNYLRILPRSESSGFYIERKDRVLFDANELSQGTAEQVYVSLRLALATTLYKKLPYPIIIDDSFVNFDHIRTEKVISLLKMIKNNQILLFTCHQHLLSYFKEESILKLEESYSQPIQS